MNFKKISLDDKDLFDSYFKKYQTDLGEMTFTNLFGWRKTRPIEFKEVDGHLIISFLRVNKRVFYQPVGKNPVEMIKKVFSMCHGAVFERISKEVADELKDDFLVEEDRDNFDYVYLTKDMISLKGNKLEPKRNLVRQFKQNNPATCNMIEEHITDFKELQKRWFEMRGRDESLEAEDLAVRETLENNEHLDVEGVCVRIDGKIQGFAIGERLNDETYVEHFEKAETTFKGAYQYLFNEFTKNLAKDYKFLNREQDLGINGMKKAKKSYYPVKMIEKFKIKNVN